MQSFKNIGLTSVKDEGGNVLMFDSYTRKPNAYFELKKRRAEQEKKINNFFKNKSFDLMRIRNLIKNKKSILDSI